MQVVFTKLGGFLTYEGFSGMLMRTVMGLGKEIPFYYTKYLLSDEDSYCVKGESMGKIWSIILDYSI
jgi:hypothetical protein